MDLPLRGIRTTQEIYKTLTVGTDNRINHAIPIAKALQLPERELLIDPYVLGAWLGDGTATSGAIAGIDEEVFEHVGNSYHVTRHANPVTRGVLGLQKHLKIIGVLGNKHIPVTYLRSSFHQRLGLLQGLMDTDGYCDKRGQCEIQLTRKDLIDGVYELILSLGIKAVMNEGIATLNGREIGPKWRIKFMTEHPVFRIARKLIRQKRAGFRGTHDNRYITDIQPTASIPTQCIQVDSPNHMYLCGREMIPTHNSSLVLGLAFNNHWRSLIMRRQYTDLGHLLEEAQKFNGGRDGFNGSPPPQLKRPDGKILDFGAASKVGNEQHWQGNPHDLIGVDEATQFAEIQIRFLMGWLRSTKPGQRKRVVLATNPPLSAEGLWVTEMFAPWLDEKFENPAAPGELRYAIVPNDKEVWVDGPEPVWNEEMQKFLEPKSYTYIPAALKDNPFLAGTGYDKELDALPEEIRTALMGGFRTTFKDAPMQIIPTEWVRLAQQRWREVQPDGIPMCSIGVDCTGGGTDPMVIAARYDGWFAPFIEIQGKDMPIDGINKATAGHIVTNRKDGAEVIIDMGGGYGSGAYEILKDNDIDVYKYMGAEGTTKRSKDGKLKFTNTRTAALWLFREALDPDQPGGSPIALPPSIKVMADLCAPTFQVTPNGIKAKSKEEVCKDLGRSTNHGDAVIMAWFRGPTGITHSGDWAFARESRKQNRNPSVVMGRKNAKRR